MQCFISHITCRVGGYKWNKTLK